MKSVVNQVLRESSGDSKGYMIDPFYHYTPEREILIDLKEGTFNPKLDEDDVERYYRSIVNWFHQVLPKEGISMEVIDKAILKITPNGKECIIEAQGRTFHSFLKF
ncbi:MAG: hypothetical protein EAX91_15605 [Candidatus Lokiarchaeota archaeon]|nr:hypothetical protein [Candidatus Lokiarchaeota archaeon]